MDNTVQETVDLEKKIEEERLQKDREDQAAFLKVFVACFGVITTTCRKTEIPYRRYQRWMANDAEFRSHLEESKQEINDAVEELFIENDLKIADKRGMIARMFYLKTHNRHYVENRSKTISEKQEAYSAEDYFKERKGKRSTVIEKQ